MADTIPQAEYDSAAAVFSQSFRFVEWKYVIAAKGLSAPLGDRDEPPVKATRKIDRRKWIYVFRHDEREAYAAIKEEIRVDVNGQMYATPTDRIERPIKQRGTPAALGETMSLPRRIFGKPKVYRFYASRVRLPLAQIKELEKVVHTFVPRTIFDPNNNTSVVMQDGKLLVPVVDPITIALHLHAAFAAAADDVIDYTSPHKGLLASDRKAVERRRKKHLLGTLLKAIIGEDTNTGANYLVHELKGEQHPLETFLIHYDQQLQARVNRRDRLAAFLIGWLASEGMKVAAAAHKTYGKNVWVQFFVPWCHVITRLFESPAGRKYLGTLLDDKGHFVHTYVLPQAPMSADALQAVRKGGMTVFEGWSALVEAQAVIKGTGHMPDIVNSLRYLRNLPQTHPLTIKATKRIESLDRTITAVQLIDPGPIKEARPFSTGAKSMSGIIESVNLVLAVKALDEALKGDKPEVRELAILNLVGSSLDATSAVASLLKKGEKVTKVLGVVSGVIDIVVGVKEMNKAFADGDQDIANGAFLTAAGATIGTAGSVLAFGAVPGGQAVMVVGLAIVAIGMIYKWLKGKEPLQRFFQYSSWGKGHDLIVAGKVPGHPEWSPTPFKQWKGEKEFDNQLGALLNIICKPDVSHDPASFRNLTFKSGWLPPNSKLLIGYQEKWVAGPFFIESEIVIGDKGPVTNDRRIVATPDGKAGVNVKVVSGVPAVDPGRKPVVHKSLKAVSASARLIITLEGTSAVKVPHDKPVKQNFV